MGRYDKNHRDDDLLPVFSNISPASPGFLRGVFTEGTDDVRLSLNRHRMSGF